MMLEPDPSTDVVVVIEEGKLLESHPVLTQLSPYPLDMDMTFTRETLGADGIPYHKSAGYQPGSIAHYALAHWNAYLATNQEEHRSAFLLQARWLTRHALLIQTTAAGWPASHPSPFCLSATIQGSALSVLLRAYLLTEDKDYLRLAHLVFATFELDILDGGIMAPVAGQGLWFEEFALYPAAHSLSGMLIALLALHEFAHLIPTRETSAMSIFERAFATLYTLLPEFDTGYWLRNDLLHCLLITPEQFALNSKLLNALAYLTDDIRAHRVTKRWQQYPGAPGKRLCRSINFSMNCWQCSKHKLLTALRLVFFPRRPASPTNLRICVPITAFPLAGGMRTILDKIEKSMQLPGMRWQMTYMTQHIGPQDGGYHIERFGIRLSSPRQFPLVWAYVLLGGLSLFQALFRGASYDLLLPQDGLFTAAFTAILGRLAGIRVVCIDHGNLAALSSKLYRQERLQSLTSKHWLRRHLEPWLFSSYWPSLHLLARISARFVDCYAIPGVVGDGIEEICRGLGIPLSRLVRFVNTVDVEQYMHQPLHRASMRVSRGIAVDAIVITTICRLSPEKGIEIALQALDQALSQLSSALRARVRFIIAGDGVLRPSLEKEIMQRGLGSICTLWGEISPDEARMLHILSDIYVYSGTRGGGYSLVMLEAMVAASAVLASDVPLANVRMLEDERGLLVSAGDVAQTAQALVRLIENEELCLKLGKNAREYISRYNTEQEFRRVWLRATCWSDLAACISGPFVEGKGKQADESITGF